ncbi:MAG: hypothetical protein FJ387_28100, partial [Verrucomicrobia bacterium]|nr:hypothetical protein [Verrucomicrobiota bacterium]
MHRRLVYGLVMALATSWLAMQQVLAGSLTLIDGFATNVAGPVLVGFQSASNTLVITNGGELTCTSSRVGEEAGATNNLAVVAGRGSKWTLQSGLSVGIRATSNSIAVVDGGALEAKAGLQLGGDGTNNSFVVHGGGSIWLGSGVDLLGLANRAIVSAGGRLVATGLHVQGSKGTVTVAGPDTTVDAGDVRLGSANFASSNLLEVLDGAHLVCRSLRIGDSTGARANRLVLRGSGSSCRVTGLIDVWPDGPHSIGVFDGARLECQKVTSVRAEGVTFGVEGTRSVWLCSSDFTAAAGYSPSGALLSLLVVDGGTLAVTNSAGNAQLSITRTHLRLEGGALHADSLTLTGFPARVSLAHGLIWFRTATLAPYYTDRGAYLPGLRIGDPSETRPMEVRGDELTCGDLTLYGKGHLAAGGRAEGVVTNFGTLSIGNPVGTLRVTPLFSVGPSLQNLGALCVDLAGPTAGTGHDVLDVRGAPRLGGKVEVTLLGAFRPAWTNQFSVIRWRSYQGAFTNDLPGSRLAVGPGSFRVLYTPTGLTLTDYLVDADGDGIDDLWAQTYFGHMPLSSAERLADNDGDSVVNQDEFSAGTDPTDVQSVFRIVAVVSEGSRVRLRFGPAASKWYRVWHASTLPLWREIAQPDFAQPEPGL